MAVGKQGPDNRQAVNYRSRDGVQIAPRAERYELLMRPRAGRDVRAVSGSFDALLDLKEQLARLGYRLVRLTTE